MSAGSSTVVPRPTFTMVMPGLRGGQHLAAEHPRRSASVPGSASTIASTSAGDLGEPVDPVHPRDTRHLDLVDGARRRRGSRARPASRGQRARSSRARRPRPSGRARSASPGAAPTRAGAARPAARAAASRPASTPNTANSASGSACTPAEVVNRMRSSAARSRCAARTCCPPPAGIVCTQRRPGFAATVRASDRARLVGHAEQHLGRVDVRPRTRRCSSGGRS